MKALQKRLRHFFKSESTQFHHTRLNRPEDYGAYTHSTIFICQKIPLRVNKQYYVYRIELFDGSTFRR